MSTRPAPEYQPPVITKHALPLSGEALIALMRAVHAKGLPYRFRAGGFSMDPFIRDGDVISVAPPSARLPRKGDVVAFRHPETHLLCVHRVLSVGGDLLLIQGDNMPQQPDGLIPRAAVLGRVTRVERGGRRVRLGLGPERRLIALLSRGALLAAIRRYAGPVCRYFRRRRAE